MRNQFAVGAVGRKIAINNIAPRPELTAEQALELSAWLAASAMALRPTMGATAQLTSFLKMIVDASDDAELSDAVDRELEE